MPVEDFAPVVGQRFRFLAKPMPSWDGVINCEVVAVEPPRRMVIHWQGSRMRTPTTLTWTLEPADGGTRLRIDHQGFEGPGGVILGFMHNYGWRKMSRRQLAFHLRSRQAALWPPSTARSN